MAVLLLCCWESTTDDWLDVLNELDVFSENTAVAIPNLM